jgi:hypothetical protein
MFIDSHVFRICMYNIEQADKPDLTIQKTIDTDDLDELERMNPLLRDTCVDDYLIINSARTAYVYCSKRKLILPPICAPIVTIQYKASAQPLFTYRGFKLYFEWVTKPMDAICETIIDPSLQTTTPIDEPQPYWAQNLDLSPMLSKHICLGTSTTLRCPRPDDYVLSIVDASYAATGTGVCAVPSFTHCYQETSLSVSCARSCLISYDIPKPLSQCGNRNGDYLNIDYECIPTRLPNNANPVDICTTITSDSIITDTGMMISPQYPSLGSARSCSKKIETSTDKVWMIFIVDLFLEGENDAGICNAASLTITDGDDKLVHCGLHQPELVLVSCSNVIQFDFVSTHQAIGYRGFKVYFKAMQRYTDWACSSISTNITTSTTRTTAQPPTTTTLLPPSSQSRFLSIFVDCSEYIFWISLRSF